MYGHRRLTIDWLTNDNESGGNNQFLPLFLYADDTYIQPTDENATERLILRLCTIYNISLSYSTDRYVIGTEDKEHSK